MPLRDVIAAIERARPGITLDQLSEAANIAAHWLRLADGLLDHFVDQARQADVPWAEIGACLGVSRQAAQKRFAARGTARAATNSQLGGAGS
ncbi:hypothetical protein [Nocardia donostiensis]|uniref:Uncharacterized protein n=1 Tax=Nocardia donostiensis TaxID=1538463 RepID=A0A1W0B7G4_9NOCA|nr:hypothetical protein [Nocardia donostiensis]ONM46238.1 hypothetical protein B0T46_23935 [Nocardia donostiensis]OQS13337.1 hypothetical protein B0T36_19660 [Nocardia donostiensis]OQS18437.1 hypothetical protein B0T44_19755 [Nocardia donostiensis]